MRTDVLTVHEEDLVTDLHDALVGKNLHGAPVVNDEGDLVGIVSQLDVHVGSLTRSDRSSDASGRRVSQPLRVKEIMTAPAVSATEETDLVDLCKMMHKLRLHRVPIVNGRKVTGVISSLDVCGAVGRGEKFD